MSDDEWEYEYHASETTDFYLTLDLTSRAAPANKRGANTRIDVDFFNAANSEARDTPDAPTPDAATIPAPRPDGAEVIGDDPIQILDLHRDNPIVSYRGQLFNCHWASTIGTDLFFARHEKNNGDEDDDDDDDEAGNVNVDQPQQSPPLRSLNTFDLLGASSTRLVGTTAQLKARSELVTNQQRRNRQHAFAAIQTPGHSRSGRSNTTQAFPVAADAPRGQKRQAGFLEQLSAVKARMGETDHVRATASTNRGHNLRGDEMDLMMTEGADFSADVTPEGSAEVEELQQQQAEEEAAPAPAARGATPGRRRGRARRGAAASGRARRGRRGSKYDSPLRNEVGAETAARPTPASWDELEQPPVRPSPLRRTETMETEGASAAEDAAGD
ncbi:uncharacterized protein K452DRAFT_282012 [Aplosporella prunicola CBS 121167]|uniref:Transcription factor TFIIIC triple barrel domain-containing protein n=1 Tax=Aplosporella prunicola CBS 121167 TaxID=1176127 RepID=A0A6A6BUS1_9PEZI|nr:uncharacterized protein K452DRAFT_282012 [Aplosporella prunicola CBS 121167]KAF2147025.1 hypothetical protein K452DRAFT_282012 [Aplosporella prunicola CBS 121167]